MTNIPKQLSLDIVCEQPENQNSEGSQHIEFDIGRLRTELMKEAFVPNDAALGNLDQEIKMFEQSNSNQSQNGEVLDWTNQMNKINTVINNEKGQEFATLTDCAGFLDDLMCNME